MQELENLASMVTELSIMKPTFTEEELALLEVLLAPETELAERWRKWVARFSIQGCSAYSKRQLPRVCSRLAPADRCSALVALEEENTKRTERLFRASESFFEQLQAEAIPFIVLKSLSLVLLGYEAPGARVVYDIDVLVPYSAAERAYQILCKLKWRLLYDHENDIHQKRFVHAIDMKLAGGGKIDLHWHLLADSLNARLDEALWSRRRLQGYRGRTYSLLSASDLFFNLCIHGAYAMHRKYDWAIDCQILLRNEGDKVDWSAVVHQARTRELLYPLRRCMEFLSSFDVALPESFLRELSDARLSVSEKMVRYVDRRGTNTLVGGAPAKFATILRIQRGPIETSLPFTVLDYLRFSWELENRWSVLGSSLKKCFHIPFRFLRRRLRTG